MGHDRLGNDHMPRLAQGYLMPESCIPGNATQRYCRQEIVCGVSERCPTLPTD
jgi:hypothetical protein